MTVIAVKRSFLPFMCRSSPEMVWLVTPEPEYEKNTCITDVGMIE